MCERRGFVPSCSSSEISCPLLFSLFLLFLLVDDVARGGGQKSSVRVAEVFDRNLFLEREFARNPNRHEFVPYVQRLLGTLGFSCFLHACMRSTTHEAVLELPTMDRQRWDSNGSSISIGSSIAGVTGSMDGGTESGGSSSGSSSIGGSRTVDGSALLEVPPALQHGPASVASVSFQTRLFQVRALSGVVVALAPERAGDTWT